MLFILKSRELILEAKDIAVLQMKHVCDVRIAPCVPDFSVFARPLVVLCGHSYPVSITNNRWTGWSTISQKHWVEGTFSTCKFEVTIDQFDHYIYAYK